MTLTTSLDMCKIQQKHFLHNLVSMKESEMKEDLYGLTTYSKISPTTKEDCFKVELVGFKKISQSTIQFILFVLHQATEKNLSVEDRVLYLSPTEYKGYRNLKNQDSLRDKINRDLKIMTGMFLSFDDLRYRFDKKTGLRHSYSVKMNMNIISSTSTYKKKIICIAFTPEFIDYYRSLSCMKIPREIFSIDTRINRNSVAILWHFAVLKNMNKEKTNNGIVSVTNLLKRCPCIPDYESLKEKGQVKQRIITPLIRDLKALKSVEWEFIDLNNNIVKAEDIKSFAQFADLKIKYEFKDKESEK